MKKKKAKKTAKKATKKIGRRIKYSDALKENIIRYVGIGLDYNHIAKRLGITKDEFRNATHDAPMRRRMNDVKENFQKNQTDKTKMLGEDLLDYFLESVGTFRESNKETTPKDVSQLVVLAKATIPSLNQTEKKEIAMSYEASKEDIEKIKNVCSPEA